MVEAENFSVYSACKVERCLLKLLYLLFLWLWGAPTAFQWIPRFEGPRREAKRLPRSNPEVKNEWSCISAPTYSFVACTRGAVVYFTKYFYCKHQFLLISLPFISCIKQPNSSLTSVSIIRMPAGVGWQIKYVPN